MKFFRHALPAFTLALDQVSAFVTLPASHQVAGVSRRQAAMAWTSAAGAGCRRAASSTRLSMGIFDDVTAEMKASMKSGDKPKLEGLRMVRAAFLTETKAAGSGDKLPDEKCIAILRKMSKQQQESIDMYRKGKRDDLVEKETKTKQLIDAMLPQTLLLPAVSFPALPFPAPSAWLSWHPPDVRSPGNNMYTRPNRQLADEATTQKWVDEAIASAGAKGPSDMGKVMGLLMKAHKTEMDGGLAQRLVSAQLKGA
ncbi:unnamed protein product [Ectocarpus sp. 12 AP-2014]